MPAVLVRPGQPLSASRRQGLLVRPPFPAKAAQAQGSSESGPGSPSWLSAGLRFKHSLWSLSQRSPGAALREAGGRSEAGIAGQPV